jgi:hypothetical protein
MLIFRVFAFDEEHGPPDGGQKPPLERPQGTQPQKYHFTPSFNHTRFRSGRSRPPLPWVIIYLTDQAKLRAPQGASRLDQECSKMMPDVSTT